MSLPESISARTVKTTCPYCGTGCGVEIRLQSDGLSVAGDAVHPTNTGKLCVKGAALGETLVPSGRLLHPMMRDPGADASSPLLPVNWETALDHVADRFRHIIREHGPDAVAWYVSGQLLTEDYYVVNKLVKGFVGTANVDTNSRLCMSSAVAGHKRAFGEDIVPVAYEDLEQADLIVLVGSNTAWCHPILYQRMLKAKAARPQMRIVVIDPRRTATTESADLHLPLRAGTDVLLFNGLLAYLQQHGVIDEAFVSAHTRGVHEALQTAIDSAGDLADVARRCGLERDTLEAFYALFAQQARVITAFSMGVNQSSAGTDKVNSIINCHLLTGRIGKPGAGPFSITGQPNAMGGREVGGLSNMLAAHMDLENAEHRSRVQRFWNSPQIASRPGLRAVELFDAIERGDVKAVWIMATNPVVSLPDADQVQRALSRCELVVVSDVMRDTDTTAYAHVLLPAQAWGEKDGTVTNSERCISRQRAFLPPPGDARPDWWALSEVARRWGYAAAFAYRQPHEIFDEHARLTAFENDANQAAPRYLNLAGLRALDKEAYDALQPVRWPIADGPAAPASPVFADGRYYHADRRARFIATPPRAPRHAPDEDYPLILNTGRVRDHWHTMTRTGLSPRLAAHIAEPYVDLHASDASRYGVHEHALARIHSRWGSLVARVRVSGELSPGNVFVPIHWNAQYASDARVGALVNPVVDPVSGEPEFKHTPVRIEPFAVAWHGFALSRRPLPMQDVAWWTRVTGQAFLRYEMAGSEMADPAAAARRMLGVDVGAEWLEVEDRGAGLYRVAVIVDGRIDTCLFIAPQPALPARSWLSSLFVKPELDAHDRAGLLAGQALGAGPDPGPTVCSCFGIGRTAIDHAITAGCSTVEQLGAKLRCGTNCGSCIPELRRLIGAATPAAGCA